MAPAPDGDQEPMLARELDRGNDVSHVATAGNQARPPLNHAIINFARRLIARIVRLQQFFYVAVVVKPLLHIFFFALCFF
jgi:hypothetical protein